MRTIIEKSTGSGLSIITSSRDKQVLGAGSVSQQNHFNNILS